MVAMLESFMPGVSILDALGSSVPRARQRLRTDEGALSHGGPSARPRESFALEHGIPLLSPAPPPPLWIARSISSTRGERKRCHKPDVDDASHEVRLFGVGVLSPG